MKLTLDREISLEEIASVITPKFPEYAISIGKNPILGFQFIVIKKSSFKGAFIRVKGNQITVDGAIPDAWARFLLIFTGGWLLMFIFQSQGANQIGKPISDFLNNKYVLKTDNSPVSETFTNKQNPVNQIWPETENQETAPSYLKITSIVGILLFAYYFLRNIYFTVQYGFYGTSIVSMILILLGLVSFVLMLKQKKAGFFVFVGIYGIRLIMALINGYIFQSSLLILFLLIETALLIVNAINLKHYK